MPERLYEKGKLPRDGGGLQRRACNTTGRNRRPVKLESPSLRPRLPELLAQAYPAARLAASIETDLPPATFPETCPFTLDEMQAEDWLP